MQFFRLIKPDWAKTHLANGEVNPKFIREIQGEDTIDGCNLSQEFITQKNNEGYNTYFFPNHPSTNVYDTGVKWLSGKHINTFNFLFVDMDLKDGIYATKELFLQKLLSFPLKPSMVVDSGNGIHAYWSVTDLTRDVYVYMQMALLHHFNTDDSVYTVLQLMRYPGSLNTKIHDAYKQTQILTDYMANQSYQISDFPNEIITALPEDKKQKAQMHLDKLDGKYKVDLPEFVNVDELPEKFLEFMNKPGNSHIQQLFNNPKEATGDRSKSDMRLANILFKAGFNKKEAFLVIANTQKALEKGPSRMGYAEMTIDKVYNEQLIAKYKTVGQKLRTEDLTKNLGQLIKGTHYFDYAVLGEPWRKKELLGLIAGPGVGKTTVTLKIMKDSILNNPENDDIYIFFTLEMSEGEIISRWTKLVGKDSPLAERLYVIGNEDEKGEPRNIGLQEIYEIASDIKKMTGKNISIMAVDHIGIISKHIDTRKKYTFGIQSEVNAGYDDVKTLSLNTLATQMKSLCKMLDTFIIVLTQTTKEKGVGDLPIGKDGAYGISQYENIMDRIMTIWQPLQRVQNKTPLKFLAWQYAKIRNKHELDSVQSDIPHLLTYDIKTGDFRISTSEEYQEFNRMMPLVKEARDAAIKKTGSEYSIQSFLNNTGDILKKLTGGTQDANK